jgi:hypothetical protein
LGQALAGYEQELRRLTRPVFDYTQLSAALDDPAPLSAFYTAVARNPEATQQMMNVLAGTGPYREFFNRANIVRVTDAAPADAAR